jgi:aminopeptidase N
MKTDTPRPVRLEDYRPPAFLVDDVRLDVSLHPTRTRVKSRLKLRANPVSAESGGPLRLDGENLELAALRLDRKPLDPKAYQLTEMGLTIPRPPAKPFTLEATTYVNPDVNKALQGLYRSRGVYCTQCEAEGFRRITFFPDRPDVLARYEVRVEADAREAPMLLSNGNLVEQGQLARGRHYAVWRDPFPKPCYLFALVGGDLASVSAEFTTMSGRVVALNIWVEHGKQERARWALDSLQRAMRWDERRFGREYDLDVFNIVAVSDFNMGAMENKGLNIFNDRLILASPDTATDAMFEHIEAVVAHEYFHNWTGNRITCRDWFQLCLKEGLTVFRDQEFSADERSPTVQRIADVRQLKTQQFAEDAGPLAHPVRPDTYLEINNFYTATVYEKGAEVVRMIQTLLGPDLFRRGMDLYFERHDGQAATVEDFLACFAEVSGRDLTQFERWYTQAGTPELVCSLGYDKAAKTAELRVEQVLPRTPDALEKKPMQIPLRFGLLGANGQDVPLKLADGAMRDDVVHVTKASEVFRFLDVPSRPVPSLLRGFSAPVNLTIDLSDRDLEFLMANDGDLFNRWQAANTFATRTLIQMVEALAQGRRTTRGAGYVKALGATLQAEGLDAAYRAELLKLPSQSDIAREIGSNVDPDLVHRAHRRLSRLIGTSLREELVDIYRATGSREPFSPDAVSAGRRRLRNAALTMLTACGTPEDMARAAEHYFAAASMTERAHAMTLLAAESAPEREKVLAHFFEHWKDDHIVIDTWFAAQAQSPLEGTLDEVKRLMGHPLFALTAPNKVRALIGTFAMHNPVQFNRRDGAGYEFVADQVLAIDRFNPQIAARMLASFRTWQVLEPGRRKLAKRALRRISSAPGLSRDVTEIVSKMLER